MRLLHVSDWHLGRVTYNQPRAEDHEQVLAEIVDIARQEKPDLILHTGDLFDTARPAYADMDRAIRVLQDLGRIAPVVVLAGNHDSPALFRLFGELLTFDRSSAEASATSAARVRFIHRPKKPSEGGILRFELEGGEVAKLAALPFIHANRRIKMFEDDPATWTAAYADQIAKVEQVLGAGLAQDYDSRRDVLLFAAHLHVAGAKYSNSERPLHITDTYATRVEQIPAVSYAAFGHIHKPQKLPTSDVQGRFAGSPIQLDFGEVGENKEVVLVESRPGKPAEVKSIPLRGGRPLRRIEGTLEQIRAGAEKVGKSLCLVTVKTEKPVTDLSEQLRVMLPQAVLLQVREDCEARQLQVAEEDLTERSRPEQTFEELFREYLAEHPTKGASVDGVLDVFSTLVRAVEVEETPSFPEEGLLLADRLGETGSVVAPSSGPGAEEQAKAKRTRKRKTAEAG